MPSKPTDKDSQKINPDWVAEFVTKDSTIWESALRTTMEAFLSEYTLHDSGWRGIFKVGRGVAIISLLWDTHWAKGRIPYPEWGGGQFLFIRLRPTRIPANIERGRDGIVTHATSTVLKKDVPPNQRCRTTIQFLDDELELVNDPEVEILCLDWQKNVVTIPMKDEAISP